MQLIFILNNFRNSKEHVNTDRAGAVHEIEIETETETETIKISSFSNLLSGQTGFLQLFSGTLLNLEYK
jgi:hypothetical protein